MDGGIGATERLYYTNAALTSFEGQVVAIRSGAGAHEGRCGVALDRSAFYPTSGGQPHDTGLLGGLPVVDVTVDEGIVWHWLDGAPAWQPGVSVAGSLDWPRRFDHMQQHSAQHLLSQVFARLFEAETLSVHFGAEESTLDLDMPALEPGQIEAAEALAAETVYAALPITAYSVAEVEVGLIPLRRPPAVSGAIRIVEIGGFDWSACGGTHCATTALLGPIKILRTERRRGGVRVSFVAGARSLADYRQVRRLLGESAALFSSDMAQVPVLIQRQMEAGKDLTRRLDEMTARLLTLDAESLLAAAQPLAPQPGSPLLIRILRDDLDAPSLRTLAATLVERAADPPGALVLAAGRQGGNLLLAFGRSRGLEQHMGNLMRETLALAGGKGGGRPEFAQGGGVSAHEAERLLDAAVTSLRRSMTP
jgi:alanyl-tRNA synthetase